MARGDEGDTDLPIPVPSLGKQGSSGKWTTAYDGPAQPNDALAGLAGVGRALNIGQSAFDVLTVYADNVIPGPGQGTLYNRFDLYRRSGADIDKAANRAMEDYGQALGEFAETDTENLPSRAVAQGSRVLGTAQSILAPAPIPGGAALPIGAGMLRMGGKAAAKSTALAAESKTPSVVRDYEQFLKTGDLPATNTEPSLAPGMVRLYRGQSSITGLGDDAAGVRVGFEGNPERVRFFTTDKDYAQRIARGTETGSSPFNDKPGTGQVVHLDVPQSVAERYRLTNNSAALESEKKISGYRGFDDQIFVVPSDVAKTAADLRAARSIHGLGATGGEAPLPPAGPKFSGNQFPESVRPELEAIQKTSPVTTIRPKISLVGQAKLAEAEADKSLAQLTQELEKVGPGQLSPKVLEVNNRVAGMIGETQKYREAIANGAATPGDQLNYANSIRQALFGRAAAIGATSEAARTTGASGRIPITARLSEKDRSIMRAIDEAAKNDPAKFEELANQLAQISHDPKKLDALVRKMGTDKGFWENTSDMFFEYYRANVLWNPATHITNSVSGLYQTGSYVARELATNPRAVKNLPSLAKGYGQAAANVLPELLKNFLGSYIGFFDDLPRNLMHSDITNYAEIGRANAIPGVVGEVVRTPFRALQVGDLFQTQPLFNFALKNKMDALARSRGLKGKQYQEFVGNPPAKDFNAVQEAAWKEAEEYALHAPSKIASAIQEFRNANPLLKAMILFVNTPYNLAKLGMRLSPLGATRAIPAAFSKEGRARLPQIAAEAAIGSTAVAGFMGLLGSDNMTGLVPKSSAERQLWEAEGRGPMMIRATEYPIIGPVLKMIYGDKAAKTWVTANLLGPLLYPALMASAADGAVSEGAELTAEHAVAAAGSAGRTLLNTLPLFQTYNGVQSVLESGSLDAANRFLLGLAKPLIPAVTLLGAVERARDGFKRAPKDFAEGLKAIVPVLGEEVNPALDVLGRQIPVQTGPLALLPKALTENPPSVVLEWDRRLRDANPNFVGLSKPVNNFGVGDKKITLSSGQFQRYQVIAGQAKDAALTALVQSPRFAQMSISEQSKEFQFTEDKAQSSALRAFGIELAANANDTESVLLGARLATRSGDNYQQGKSLMSIGPRITPALKAAIDGERANPDRAKAAREGKSYDPTVDELIHGSQLVDAWMKAPAFVFGTREQWDAAARGANEIRRLTASFRADGKISPSEDAQLSRYYFGQPALATFYDRDGSVKSAYVSRARTTIEQDVDWRLFANAAHNAEAARLATR